MRCKKCGGKIQIDRDQYGLYLNCMNCGAIYENKSTMPFPRPVTQRESDKEKRMEKNAMIKQEYDNKTPVPVLADKYNMSQTAVYKSIRLARLAYG
jgi:transcription initiation factor TFIIIB Brf1 subunit/transcription initiation factor TFIIB